MHPGMAQNILQYSQFISISSTLVRGRSAHARRHREQAALRLCSRRTPKALVKHLGYWL
jgi:hypothetical protein